MRTDGRKERELRPIVITPSYIKSADGSVLIEVGDTRVICTAKLEDKVPPFLRNSGKGWITAEYGMLPSSSQVRISREAARGRIGGRTHEIQRLIGRSLRTIADLKSLGERTIWIDCDVIQADGGTRTAGITGAFVALHDAITGLMGKGLVKENPLKDFIAAISVGIYEGVPILDLDYAEDSACDTDMNVVMLGNGHFVEVQGTAEGHPFTRAEMDELLELAKTGIEQLIGMQHAALAG